VVVLLERVLWIISLLFGIAVLVIIGNTIRLAIESRREQIIVVKLVGGTDAFVCRPFLYLGALLGLSGGLLAVIVVHTVVTSLSQPVQALVASYQGSFGLSGLGFLSTLSVLLLGAGLGWLGAWLAVRRHLKEAEPT
jgi:cell division transport system permease protein